MYSISCIHILRQYYSKNIYLYIASVFIYISYTCLTLLYHVLELCFFFFFFFLVPILILCIHIHVMLIDYIYKMLTLIYIYNLPQLALLSNYRKSSATLIIIERIYMGISINSLKSRAKECRSVYVYQLRYLHFLTT